MTSTVAIEIKGQSLRVVVAESGKSGTPDRITVARSVTIPSGESRGELGIALKTALQTAQIQGGRVHIVLPRSQSYVRKSLLPSSDPEELAGMARFEAERHLPIHADRHIVVHAALGKPAVEGTEVLIAAVDEPVALEALEVAQAAGLVVASIGISTLALFRAWLQGRGANDNPGTDSSPNATPTLLIHLDEDAVELVIVSKGQPIYNRSAPVGTRRLVDEVAAAGALPFTEAELSQLDALEPHKSFLDQGGLDPAAAANEPQGSAARSWLLRLLREIRQTVDFARREAGAPSPEAVFITGSGAVIRHLPEFITTNTGAPVTVWDPWEGTSIQPTAEALQSVAGREAYAVLAGALMDRSTAAPYPNLIPARYLTARREKDKKRFLIISAVQLVAILLLGYLLLAQRLSHMEETIDKLRSLNQTLSSAAADLMAKQTRNRIVRNFIRGNSTPADVMNRISEFEFIPGKVTLTRFEFKKDDYVKITGHALDIQAVNAMESALRQTGLFTKVSQDQGSNAPVQLPNRGKEGTVLQYSITCEFAKPGSRSNRNSGTATVVTQ